MMTVTTAQPRVPLRHVTFVALTLAILIGIFVSAAAPQSAAAQSGQDDPWSLPVNVSNSGGISAPDAVVDAAGVLHVIWFEKDIGYNYARFADGEWSQPVIVDLPFGETAPLLLAGEEYIYAFWIDQRSNDALSFSRVAPERFAEKTAWEAPERLSRRVAGVSASYQPGGRMHVVYVQLLQTDSPNEGLVHIQSLDQGTNWSAPNLIYPTKYFRSIQSTAINLQVTAAANNDQETVSVVWDNPAVKRVFYARSADGGVTWEAATEADGPSLAPDSNSPFKIRVAAHKNLAVRLWQGNLQSGLYCTQFYQYSQDGGRTWSERGLMLKNIRGCAISNDLMVLADGTFLLQSVFPDEVYLTVFDGKQWSDPQLQSVLATFESPATTERLSLRCQKPMLANGKRLYVVGCDEGGPVDAWVMWKDISGVEGWFPRPSAWSAPLELAAGSEPIYAARGVADNAGRVHIVWVQRMPPDANNANARESRSIYYAFWDGETLSEPGLVLQSPDHYVGAFSLAYDQTRDRLLLAWEAGKKGELFFSWAGVAGAASALEWAAPVSLPVVETMGRAPDIAVRDGGVIFVAYTIPVNEYRGVYLVKSVDGGVTWSEPILVYNAGGVAQMVDAPRLALSGEQDVHLLWSENSVLADPGPINLVYARSTDDGITWPAPTILVNEPVGAWWILNAGEAGLQRFWTQKGVAGYSLFQDSSLDRGATWSFPGNLTGVGENLRSIDIDVSQRGDLDLAQIIEDSSGGLALRTLAFSDEGWQVEDSLALEDDPSAPLHSLDSALLADGRRVAFYVTQKLDAPDDTQPWEIMLRVRNPQAGGASAQPTRPAVEATPVAAQTEPPAAVTQAVAAAQQTAAPTAEASAAEASAAETSAAPTPTPAAAALVEATPTRGAQITLAPGAAPEKSALDSNLGLFLAGGVSLVVVAVFFAYTRYKHSQ